MFGAVPMVQTRDIWGSILVKHKNVKSDPNGFRMYFVNILSLHHSAGKFSVPLSVSGAITNVRQGLALVPWCIFEKSALHLVKKR